MAEYMLLGLFDNVSITADVIEEVRQLGVDDDDVTVMSNVPYASKFFGRKTPHQRFLPFVLGGALLGALLAAFISLGTPALYPIHVGGQALTPFPPTAIMFFELIALCTMVVTFIGFLLQNRFPVLTRQMYDERITDGYIGVQIVARESLVEQIVNVFEAHHAHVIKREDAAEYKPNRMRYPLFLGGVGAAGLVALVIPLLLTYDIVRLPWINTMKDTVAVGNQEGPRRAAPADSVPIQGPVLIAGQPATAPLPVTDASLERGKILYGINCSMCHGLQGDLQGAEVGKYFPEIPALVSERVQNLSDEEIFLTITNGQNRMPSLAENLDPGETWDIVNYVRSLGAGPGGQ
jgi:mono/diheme cytochrome c family protein